jgi:hypothetical protein
VRRQPEQRLPSLPGNDARLQLVPASTTTKANRADSDFVALQTTGVGSTGVHHLHQRTTSPVDCRICSHTATTPRRLQGLQRSIHYHRDRLQDLQRSNYNTNRLIAGSATVQLLATTAGSAAEHKLQQHLATTAGSAAGHILTNSHRSS